MSLLWWLFGFYAADKIGNAIDDDTQASYEDGYQNGYDDALSDSEDEQKWHDNDNL